MENSNRFTEVKVAPKRCQKCGAKLRRTKRTPWRKGYTECPNGCRHWFGNGVRKTVKS